MNNSALKIVISLLVYVAFSEVRSYTATPSRLGLKQNLLCFSAGVSKKKKKAKSKLLQKPGESTRKFFDRLDTQVGEALNKALMETKQLRVKRKEYVISNLTICSILVLLLNIKHLTIFHQT